MCGVVLGRHSFVRLLVNSGSKLKLCVYLIGMVLLGILFEVLLLDVVSGPGSGLNDE